MHGIRITANLVDPLIKIEQIKQEHPELYSDMPNYRDPTSIGDGSTGSLYERRAIAPLVNNLDYILEVRSNCWIGEKIVEKSVAKNILISHGRSKEWYKLQSF